MTKDSPMKERRNFYIWLPCEICGVDTNGRYMFDDIPICEKDFDTPKFLEWLRVNRPILYDFEMAE